MRLHIGDLMALPYVTRQFIVVDLDNAIADYVQNELAASLEPSNPEDSDDRAGVIDAMGGLMNRVVRVPDAISKRWKERKIDDIVDSHLLPVTSEQAQLLTFPSGHPLRSVVYVANPGVPGSYHPVSSFHRAMFDGKYAEMIRLLRSLGALTIEIEYVEGFDSAAGLDLAVSAAGTRGVDIGGKRSSTSKQGSGAKVTMQLNPSREPHIPPDLVWFGTEPLWQEIARSRLESGLRSFNVDLRYSDDFGVDRRLTSKVENFGLELGGNFSEFRETVWRLSGTFAEWNPQGS